MHACMRKKHSCLYVFMVGLSPALRFSPSLILITSDSQLLFLHEPRQLGYLSTIQLEFAQNEF